MRLKTNKNKQEEADAIFDLLMGPVNREDLVEDSEGNDKSGLTPVHIKRLKLLEQQATGRLPRGSCLSLMGRRSQRVLLLVAPEKEGIWL